MLSRFPFTNLTLHQSLLYHFGNKHCGSQWPKHLNISHSSKELPGMNPLSQHVVPLDPPIHKSPMIGTSQSLRFP